MRRAAVLGSPIAHSLSPVLHRAAYAALDLPWQYTAIDVDEASLASFWSRLDDTWVGLSITMPLKAAVIGFLDEVSERARLIGSVNTVVFADGRAIGHNTDVPGVIRALDAAAPERETVATVGIIGAGATARSVLAAVVERHGISAKGDPVQIAVFARRREQAEDLVAIAPLLGATVDVLGWGELAQAWSCDLIVSTLPGASAGELPVSIPAKPGMLLDVAYDPWPTPLTTRWRAAGGAVASGADLLLGQAVDQVRLMTGRDAPTEAMRAALVAALDERAEASI